METPILTTKLYIPTPQGTAISRPMLLAKLNQGLAGKLTLIAAPAGFGKSTLVSQWVRAVGRPVAWLTLDEDDNAPLRFLAYLIVALQQIQGACGVQTLALLQAPQPPPLETILTTLVNELALLPQPFLLVLDDYHLVETHAIHQIVNFLLTHLPPHGHLLISSRREPPLALARLRAHGALMALSVTDLRFSLTEVADFFFHSVGMQLTTEAVAALEQRTEGWAVGLRLAAVVLQAVAPSARAERFATLIANFRGDDRHVFDYLSEEVFARLATAQQLFLVQTALLERLCGPLCAAVLDDSAGQSLLDELARDNLFLLPLDNQRQWYRYHSLFADFLRHRLQRLAPAQVASLHSRAAAWYAAQGLIADAIDHALAAQDYERAASLIEANVLTLTLSNERAIIARWLRLLPPGLSETRPLLAFAQAGCALLGSQFAQAKQWVESAERALLALPPSVTLPIPANTLQGYLDGLHCTAMVNLHAPVAAIITTAQRALVHLPADEYFLRGAVALNLGDAYCRQAQNTLAAAAFAEAIALTADASNLTVHLAALGSQGELYIRQGQLVLGAAALQQAIAVGQAWGKATGQTHPVAGKAHAFYANLLCEWNRADEAEAHALVAIDCCKRWGHTQHLVDSYQALITSLYALGKVAQAQAALATVRMLVTEEWQRAQAQGVSLTAAREWVNSVDHLQLALWLRQGQWADAAQWVAAHEEDPDLALAFARVRLALARHQPADATPWLAHIDQQVTHDEHRLMQLRLLLLQAQWHHQQDRPDQALLALRTAVRLAEPGGYVRVFLNEGAPIAELLHNLVQQDGLTPYTQSLLAGLVAQQNTRLVGEDTAPPTTALVEPLSERERAVLHLLAADLTYEAIGATLVISLNTVRTHAKHIYSKLNVNRRNQAIMRARELGLL